MPDAVAIVLLFPELLGTYGDRGNAIVLAQRLRWRGQPAEIVTVELSSPVPSSGDIYLLGGGEDGPQSLAAAELAKGGVLEKAVDRGAVVLAVCAGLQILGREWAGADGQPLPGLGLLDCVTVPGSKRAIGELLAVPPVESEIDVLTGYENHGGRTRLGPGAVPLARVEYGVGNGDGTEGVVSGSVMGTYLHGPALARNPSLADHLLGLLVGPLDALPDEEVAALRTERLAAVSRGRRRFLR